MRPQHLVADVLELGQQLRMGTPDKNRLYAAFTVRHGLLGLAWTNADTPDGGPLSTALDSCQYGEPVDELNREFILRLCYWIWKELCTIG